MILFSRAMCPLISSRSDSNKIGFLLDTCHVVYLEIFIRFLFCLYLTCLKKPHICPRSRRDSPQLHRGGPAQRSLDCPAELPRRQILDESAGAHLFRGHSSCQRSSGLPVMAHQLSILHFSCVHTGERDQDDH